MEDVLVIRQGSTGSEGGPRSCNGQEKSTGFHQRVAWSNLLNLIVLEFAEVQSQEKAWLGQESENSQLLWLGFARLIAQLVSDVASYPGGQLGRKLLFR